MTWLDRSPTREAALKRAALHFVEYASTLTLQSSSGLVCTQKANQYHASQWAKAYEIIGHIWKVRSNSASGRQF